MTNIIEELNVLEQIPIKEYTTLSGILMGIGIGTVMIAMIAIIISQYRICWKDKCNKIFLIFYIFGLSLAIFAVIRFPWFYVETGKYTYKCTLENDVSANYIGDNFNVISVEDGVWKIEDKE